MFCWYERCSWSRRHPCVPYAQRRLCFQRASRESGWSAVTTEPLIGPQPMSQSPTAIGHFSPASTTRTANRAKDFRGSLSRPALCMVLNEPNSTFSFTHSHTCLFFYLRTYTSVLLILIQDPCCCLVCVFAVRKSHHSCSPVCPSSPSL